MIQLYQTALQRSPDDCEYIIICWEVAACPKRWKNKSLQCIAKISIKVPVVHVLLTSVKHTLHLISATVIYKDRKKLTLVAYKSTASYGLQKSGRDNADIPMYMH